MHHQDSRSRRLGHRGSRRGRMDHQDSGSRRLAHRASQRGSLDHRAPQGRRLGHRSHWGRRLALWGLPSRLRWIPGDWWSPRGGGRGP
ncbi:unnamed protein product, partial [Gulo gulo]